MDRETHRRFLDYLEMFPYWNAPSARKLSRDEFVELDAALGALETRGSATWTADEEKLVAVLKKRLLRD